MIKLFILLTIMGYLNASSLFKTDIKLLEYLEDEFDLNQPGKLNQFNKILLLNYTIINYF